MMPTRTILFDAARSLRRSPLFTAMVVAVLGVGVALNAAIFTVVDCVLLRPLPYPNADRIVALETHFEDRNRTIPRLGGDDYNDVAAGVKGLEAVAWYQSGEMGMEVEGRSVYLKAATVAPRFGEVMTLTPVAGRLFHGSDREGAEALVSGSFARERFGSEEAALGHSLRTYDAVRTIVGVVPDRFSFPNGSTVWLEGDARPRNGSRTSYSQGAVALRRANTSPAQLRAELLVLSGQLKRAYVDDRDKSLESAPLQDAVVGSVRPTLRLLMGSVAVLLLVVCANVTHLQLVRMTRRARLITIQTALGASRARLAAAALAETMLLGICGCAAALLLAWPMLRVLVRLAPPDVPRLQDVHLNGHVLLFSLGVCLLLMSLTAVLPVWRSWQLAPASALRQDASRGLEGRGVRRLRGGFLIAQVALTLTLCVTAVLLARQMRREAEQDFGFNAQNLTTLDTHLVETVDMAALLPPKTPAEKAHQEEIRRATETRMLARLHSALSDLRAVPGVTSAEAISGAPMGFGGSDVGYAIRGRQVFAPPYHDLPNADIHPVTPELLASMRVPLLAGRSLSAGDRVDAPRVLLVSQALAHKQFPGQNAVGKQIMCGYDDEETWWTIVGVVGDVRSAPGEEPAEIFYVPVAQHGDSAMDMQVVVRTDRADLTPDVLMKQLRQTHPEIAVRGTTMAENIGRVQQPTVFRNVLFSSFALVSILLSIAGTYGVIAYSVAQRGFEFGLRFALGAQRRDVLAMVLKQAALLCGTGLFVGLLLCAGLPKLLGTVFGRPPAPDVAGYVLAAMSVLGLTMLAALAPAVRAAQIQPIEALRTE